MSNTYFWRRKDSLEGFKIFINKNLDYIYAHATDGFKGDSVSFNGDAAEDVINMLASISIENPNVAPETIDKYGGTAYRWCYQPNFDFTNTLAVMIIDDSLGKDASLVIVGDFRIDITFGLDTLQDVINFVRSAKSGNHSS